MSVLGTSGWFLQIEEFTESTATSDPVIQNLNQTDLRINSNESYLNERAINFSLPTSFAFSITISEVECNYRCKFAAKNRRALISISLVRRISKKRLKIFPSQEARRI